MKREWIAEVLAAHEANVGPVSKSWMCACGTRSTNGDIRTDDLTTPTERQAEYRTHLSAVLAALVAEEVADAVVAAVERIGRRAAQDRMRFESGSSVGAWLHGQVNPYRRAARPDVRGEGEE